MFPPYKYIITRILRNVNKNIRKIRKNSRDFHTTKLNLPTGNLDSASSEVVIHTLEEINKKMGKTILLVTHDPIIASSCDRIIFLKDGKVKEDLKRTGDKEQFYNEIITNWC